MHIDFSCVLILFHSPSLMQDESSTESDSYHRRSPRRSRSRSRSRHRISLRRAGSQSRGRSRSRYVFVVRVESRIILILFPKETTNCLFSYECSFLLWEFRLLCTFIARAV